MPNFTVNYSLPITNRMQMRKDLLDKFILEQVGEGKGELASHYTYNVEKWEGYTIYLKRPGFINKGLDFTVNIDGVSFKGKRIRHNPKHEDIIAALKYCKSNYAVEYKNIIKPEIDCIYNCMPFKIKNSGAMFLDYNGNRHPVEIVLLALKWLFMEQDCTYWNYSGREMLYNTLKAEKLV